MNSNTIKMDISSIAENISVVRLTASGMASRAGFDYEEIEDIKVAISEACTNAIKHGKKDSFQVSFTVDCGNFIIEVCDGGAGYDVDKVPTPNPEDPKESGLGLFIIKALMDEVEIKSCKECGTVIRMSKKICEVQ